MRASVRVDVVVVGAAKCVFADTQHHGATKRIARTMRNYDRLCFDGFDVFYLERVLMFVL